MVILVVRVTTMVVQLHDGAKVDVVLSVVVLSCGFLLGGGSLV